MNGEYLIRKYVEGSGQSLIWGTVKHLLEGTEESQEKMQEKFLGQNLYWDVQYVKL